MPARSAACFCVDPRANASIATRTFATGNRGTSFPVPGLILGASGFAMFTFAWTGMYFRLKRELPHTGVIVLASNDDEDQLFDAIKAGAAAYVLKDIDPTDLIAIIRRVRSGEYLINDKVFAKPNVASRVLKEFRELAVYGAEAQPIFAPLSPREVEILDNIAQGMTNKQVAYALSISEQTVKNHMSSILRKLSVNDRTQAVVRAVRMGIIRID